MTTESLITDEARAMIGAEGKPVTGYPVTDYEIRRFAYAVDDLTPLWLDPEYAGKSRYGGIIAPPLYYSIPFAGDRPLSDLKEDGLPGGDTGFLMPPLRSTRLIQGGQELEFFEPIRPGDVITRRPRLADVYEREGRSGRLAFVVTENTYTNQRGEVVVIERQTLIAR
jgi:acyl dehydratase